MTTNTALLAIIALCAVTIAVYPWVARWAYRRRERAYWDAEEEAEAELHRLINDKISIIDQPCPCCGSRHVIQCDKSHFPFECTCKVCENVVTYTSPEEVSS
jgi:hypothetical protein